jgi:hypothetical protein
MTLRARMGQRLDYLARELGLSRRSLLELCESSIPICGEERNVLFEKQRRLRARRHTISNRKIDRLLILKRFLLAIFQNLQPERQVCHHQPQIWVTLGSTSASMNESSIHRFYRFYLSLSLRTGG